MIKIFLIYFKQENYYNENQKNFNKQNNNDKVDVNLTVIKKENSFKKLIDKIFKSLKKKFLTQKQKEGYL